MLERKHQTTKQQIRMADRQQEWQQRKMSSDAINGEMTTNEMASGDSHHVPITHRYDVDFIKRTCCLHGLDMDVPPPVPVSRPYTVRGNMKLSFPHKRVVKQNYKGLPYIAVCGQLDCEDCVLQMRKGTLYYIKGSK
jgi:hypothetical protein